MDSSWNQLGKNWMGGTLLLLVIMVVVEVVYRWSPLASHALTDRYLNSSNSSTDSLEALDWLKWIFKGPPKQSENQQPPHCSAEALTQYLMSRVTPDGSHQLQDHIAGLRKSLVSCVWREGRMSEGPEDALAPWSPVHSKTADEQGWGWLGGRGCCYWADV